MRSSPSARTSLWIMPSSRRPRRFSFSLPISVGAEGVNTEHLLVSGRRERQVCLNIAITSLRAGGLHTQGNDGVCLCNKLERGIDDTMKLVNIHNDMVAGRYNDVGMRIQGLDAPTDIGDTWSRTTTTRLGKNVTGRNLWQLTANLIGVINGSYHPDVFWRHYTTESV